MVIINVVIVNFVEVVFFFIMLDGFVFVMDNCILSDDVVFRRVNFDNFEFDCFYVFVYYEEVILFDGVVGFVEIRGEEYVKERIGKVFDGVGDWENGNMFGL